MPLFTKNGSIPSEQTDGTEGWIPAPDKPDCPEGKEVVWLNWEWNVRDPRPVDRRGYQWNWVHDSKSWVEYPFDEPPVPEVIEVAPSQESVETSSAQIQALTTEDISALSTTQISSLTTEQIQGLSQ
ncbi:hypothetical protein [Phage DSL-LC04]|nr:hypothetical protein [Phage DSL-LC04]